MFIFLANHRTRLSLWHLVPERRHCKYFHPQKIYSYSILLQLRFCSAFTHTWEHHMAKVLWLQRGSSMKMFTLDMITLFHLKLSDEEQQQMSQVSKGLNESSDGTVVQLNLLVSWTRRHNMASLQLSGILNSGNVWLCYYTVLALRTPKKSLKQTSHATHQNNFLL